MASAGDGRSQQRSAGVGKILKGSAGVGGGGGACTGSVLSTLLISFMVAYKYS